MPQSGGESQSRHMFGDAADIASNAGSWQALHDAGKNCGACVEPLDVGGAGMFTLTGAEDALIEGSDSVERRERP